MNSFNPLVSVIVPAYNAEKTILDSLESIINQTYENIEIIVIDDGSSDNTLNIVNSFARSTSKKMITRTQLNSGPSVARNYGISLSSGEYIAFLDSDDKWISNKLSSQLSVLMKDETITMIGCLFSVGKVIYGSISENIDVVSFNDLLFKNRFITSCVVCRKNVIADIGFNVNQKYSEDYLCWLRIASDGNKCVVLNDVLTIMNDKPIFGGSGLSGNLWRMEKGELSNFLYLYREQLLSCHLYVMVSSFSLLKFIRRFVMTVILNIRRL